MAASVPALVVAKVPLEFPGIDLGSDPRQCPTYWPRIERENHHGTHASAPIVPAGCTGPAHLQGDAGVPLRETSSDLRHQAERSDSGHRVRERLARGDGQEVLRGHL